MKWTREKPTQPGWYWWRDSQNPGPFMHKLEWLDEEQKELTCITVEYDFDPNDWDGEWAGPVPEPEDA